MTDFLHCSAENGNGNDVYLKIYTVTGWKPHGYNPLLTNLQRAVLSLTFSQQIEC